MSEQNHREWWLDIVGDGFGNSGETLGVYKQPSQTQKDIESVHVIEKSAFDALKAELEIAKLDLRDANHQVAELEQALSQNEANMFTNLELYTKLQLGYYTLYHAFELTVQHLEDHEPDFWQSSFGKTLKNFLKRL